ncbi:C40 family peptidase [Sporomusa malonica]|uniref:Putative peptidoglycan binding domain-containing protein n=1 Tax=Sporomusa malonica TaxID=112901 RepID=A0A1W2B2Y7_9FIRM|nr:NlpC/P60 family protein [Sporomusa malonica]SMC67365.1 Putative peptidoglycan binding domain-containing protein [Sporomusa malonica]
MKVVKITLFAVICTFFLILGSNSLAFASGEDMPVLKQGEKSEAVYALQTELKKHGFYQYGIDGNFGFYTKSAVSEFQKAVGIEDDGIVGPGTWQALRSYSGNTELSRSKSDRRIGQQIAGFAQSYLGVPYVWGGSGAGGFDCSGFIHYVYERYGIALPRVADEQYDAGRRIPLADIEPGDLVFYSTYAPGPSHVGIYVGNGQFVHASSGAGEVTLTAMSKAYYQARFLGAFRVVR